MPIFLSIFLIVLSFTDLIEEIPDEHMIYGMYLYKGKVLQNV